MADLHGLDQLMLVATTTVAGCLSISGWMIGVEGTLLIVSIQLMEHSKGECRVFPGSTSRGEVETSQGELQLEYETRAVPHVGVGPSPLLPWNPEGSQSSGYTAAPCQAPYLVPQVGALLVS